MTGADWDNRVTLQAKWTAPEKGWKIGVEWKETQWGTGVFATEDVTKGSILRTGKTGINLLQFGSLEDVLSFVTENHDNDLGESLSMPRVNYVSDYLYAFDPNAELSDKGTEHYNYRALHAPDQLSRFFGIWVPGNGLNHSPQPNVVYLTAPGGTDKGINLHALKNIRAGEELFDNYNRFGAPPPWAEQFSKKFGVTLNFAGYNNFV
eukprot:CAMPEP_0175143718 /NCGR_PEP_ID=MMETSP0087-20121206/13642_1 /TAXON_ID=136419 /ORGANISM="Unknown Unknown, Strain D1" /LENGTH=206 /DNA_ID=CAMNT_0016427927 /DNA_START=56 /DNA_END=676 /DNA_ORIENTATION=+